jgi:tetratricopeptide (TPR) repeat protein
MRILTEGARLADRYTLLRRLGRGGMGETWLATDARSETRIALKLLVGDAAADARQKEWLHREWRIGSRLMHPNIIRVFEFHDDPEGAYFGLQFVGDTDIGVLAGIDPAESMRPVAMLADALRYAHGKGIVHRDIKASNVLLDSRGLPYLVDFGVAAPQGSSQNAGSGTEIAMSPEQRAGGEARPADDVFALGILMHELLTGNPPGGADRQEIAQTVADGSSMPGALADLLADMLAPDAGRRPNAEDVAERLAAAGFPAGPAPSRLVTGENAGEEILESLEPAGSFRRRPVAEPHPAAREPAAAASGIPPKVLYGGLGAALLLLLAVIFVLPALVQPDRPGVDGTPSDASAVAGSDDVTRDAGVGEDSAPGQASAGDTAFSENLTDGASVKAATDEALGDLLSQLERLRYRAIDRWGGQGYLDAVDVYEEGDRAYVDRNYRLAGEKYREASKMLVPFFDRIDQVFEESLAGAKAAFENGDASEAVRLFDLAVAITPGNREAEAGLERARNLDSVLALMEQGLRFETNLELDAAKLAFERALEIDALWEPATVALERVRLAITNLSFEQRMTEGFDALYAGDFDTARAAFNAARLLRPDSREAADGLTQVDLEVKLADIRQLEAEANRLVEAEEWETSIGVYQDILKIDPDLQFAQQGVAAARSRAALHNTLQGYIDDPDGLSDDANMQAATRLLLDLARIDPMGPRLADQKTELSRLLKRAATPLTVQIVSDNATEVSIFKVGRLGVLDNRQIELRPGNYVAVGIRPGYRDVRVEFRVAPEIDMQPVVVRCEEQI